MTTALTDAPTKELTTQEKIIQEAQSELGEERVPPMPKIKVSYDGEHAKEGEFFLQFKDPETNEDKTVDIGAEPEVVILRRNASYSIYDDQAGDNGELILMTNEIPEQNGWLMGECPVWVLRLFPNKAVEFFGEYKEFTQWRKSNTAYQDSKGRSEIKYTNVVYVYFKHPEGHPDNIYQMFVSNASFSGEMNDPHPDHRTFESFRAKIRTSEPGVYFGTKCKLSTIERGGADETNKKEKKIRYFLINFDPTNLADLGEMADVYQHLREVLNDKFNKMFANLPREPKTIQEARQQGPVIEAIEEPEDIEDLEEPVPLP